MGPLTPKMKQLAVKREGDIKSDPLDDAQPVSRISAEEGNYAQRRLVRRGNDNPRA